MKELSIEEKAKRFDMALENAKYYHSEMGDDVCCVLEECFPELQESEDDRIRKTLINYFNTCHGDYYGELKRKDILAWLEKQSSEYALKSFKDEDVRKFMQYIKKEAKAYEFNLPNRGYDIYAFAKDILAWLEKQGKKSMDIDIPFGAYDSELIEETYDIPKDCYVVIKDNKVIIRKNL